MFRKIWKAVETKAKKTRVAKTKEIRNKKEIRKEEEIKKKKTIYIKKVVEKWEIWDNEKEAVRLEKEIKKLVLE